MANQSFTNLHIHDKQFDALQLPPKAPTSSHKPSDIEGCEILFQARNVLKGHENPSLLFLGDEQVHPPPNTPNTPKTNIHELPHHAMESAKMKRLMANRVYSARYRHKKLAMLHNLENKAKSLEAKVAMIQYQLLYWGSVRDKLVEENAMMEAHCSAANALLAEKEAENQALMEEIQRLKNIY